MKNRIVLLFIIMFSFASLLKAQTIENVLKQIDDYGLKHPQEKLYLQLDKYSYVAGETIWFKAYTTVGIDNFFSNLSGIAYIELIDATEQKVDSLIIPLGLGIGIGNISIPDTLTEGSYRLRAYTNWMRNSDDQYFYDRTLQIANGRSDDIYTTTAYNVGNKNNVYSIGLKKASGLPLADTRVRYEVIYKGKSVEKKRAITDSEGNLSIEVSSKYPSAQLKLSFANEKEGAVNKLIKLIDPEIKQSIQLLPEGGKLLEGFINTVGIKSINEFGLGQKVKLFCTNGIDTLGHFETNNLGMGAFNVFLKPGDSLYVFAEYERGNYISVDVPQIHKSGYSLQVNNQSQNKLYTQLNISEDFIDDQDVYFIAHHLGHVFFVSKQKINKPTLSFSVAKNQLPTGVITVSILNGRYEPIVERAVFNFSQLDLLSLNVSTNKNNYGNREKVQVDLEVENTDSIKISSLSASVVNLSKIKDNPNTAPNILSTLLLSSDIKGYIESPGFYFENNDLKVRDIDYLMLTQGWRNIDWKSLDLLIKYPAEKSLSISGYTKKLGRSKPEPNAIIQLIPTENYMGFIDTISNEEGYFNYDNLLFPDSINFLITAKNSKGKRNIDIVYNAQDLAPVSSNRNFSEEMWDVNTLYKEELNNSKLYFSSLESVGLKEKAKLIEEVLVTAKKSSVASKNSKNLNGAGRADQIISAEELSTCISLEMCLAGRLVGVYWQLGIPYSSRSNEPMAVEMDGMFIEPDQISMINVSDVESIEVLRNANYTSIYGANGSNGVLVISSKTGESARRNFIPAGILTIKPKGLHIGRKFYKPTYDISDQVKIIQDLRTTIHWEPLIVTNEEGRASFDFYTADEKGEYMIVVEGLDINGKICREIKQIKIQ